MQGIWILILKLFSHLLCLYFIMPTSSLPHPNCLLKTKQNRTVAKIFFIKKGLQVQFHIVRVNASLLADGEPFKEFESLLFSHRYCTYVSRVWELHKQHILIWADVLPPWRLGSSLLETAHLTSIWLDSVRYIKIQCEMSEWKVYSVTSGIFTSPLDEEKFSLSSSGHI